MITPSTATAVISLAKGAIKLGDRLDVLLAEKTAVNGTFVLPMPNVSEAPSGVLQVKELRAHLAAFPAALRHDPLGDLRARLLSTLEAPEPDAELVGLCFERVFPQRMIAPAIEPDGAYLAELRRALPGLDLTDADVLAAAFHVAAGRDRRGLNYGMRIGLLVADVVAEFGAENTARFVRDPHLRSMAQSVLERFAEPDLEQFTAWSGLLRHALSSTLNGLLDARSNLEIEGPWLSALLDVVAEARGAAGGDDFVIGLFHGRGYPLLLSEGLTRAAHKLGAENASAFQQVASAMLTTAAPLTRDRGFRGLFNDHWSDLLRGGLQALEKQAPALLRDQPELLRDATVAMVNALAATPQARLLSHESLVRVSDAAIGAIAQKPGLLTEAVGGKPWVEALLSSFVSTVSRDGVALTFSSDGLAAIVEDAAARLASHPELIIKRPEIARDVIGPVIRSVQTLGGMDAQQLARAAVAGALETLVDRNFLVDTKFSPLLVEFTGHVAELVKANKIRGADASLLVQAAIVIMRNNPRVFDLSGNFATSVLGAVLAAATSDPRGILSGPVLIATAQEVLAVTARFGHAKAEAGLTELATELSAVVRSSLEAADVHLGRGLDLPHVPSVISGVVGAWARGELTRFDPADHKFRALFSRLVAAT